MKINWGKTKISILATGLALNLATVPAMAAEPLIIADFENGSIKPFQQSDAAVVEEHATHGAKAAKIAKGGLWFNANDSTGLPGDWSGYDVFKMDVFNPTDKPIRMTIQLRDTQNRGYWSWHNRYTALAPGQNTVEFSVSDIWRGEVLRHDIPGDLDPKKIRALNITTAEGPYFIDYVRLEKLQTSKVEVPGLKAFKVAKSGMPGFTGFTTLTEKDLYSKEKGWGWTKTGFGRMDDRLHPDLLFRSWISCTDAALAVDLPNGKYRVHLQIEDPGYWEFMQNYHRRTVTAEGATVIDESMDGNEFKKRYFRNQDAEDFPGDDPFEKYVETRQPWHAFDVEVKDGQLNLDFKSADTYGNTLSAIIIYPSEQAEAGTKFIAYVKELRRSNWAQSWKNVSKPPEPPKFEKALGEEAAKNGFALFKLVPTAPMPYDYSPKDTEALTELSIAAARGEVEPGVFGLRPAAELGKVTVNVSALKGPAGEIPAENVAVRVGRYRFARYQGHISGLYNVAERQLSLFNQAEADTLRCNNTMARRFWIIVRVPEAAAPGDYNALVTVSSEKGGKREIPLKVKVLPFTLPQADHLFTLYGVCVLPLPYYPEIAADYPRQTERTYQDLRDHGINYIDELKVNIKWDGKKATVANVDKVNGDLALRKKIGFKEAAVSCEPGCTLKELSTPGSSIRGLPQDKFIEGWHKALTDFYKAQNWPHPYFCYGDEPGEPDTLEALTAANNAVHAVSPDIWMGIAYHVGSPQSYELLKTLDVQHLKAFCKTEDFMAAKKAGKLLVRSNIGSARIAFGADEWNATQERKCDACTSFSYTGSHVDLYYGLDAREDDYSMAPPRMDGSLATSARWELIREGIDDYRYAAALQALANNAKTPAETVESAKKLLAELINIGSAQKGADDPALIERVTAWRGQAQTLLGKAAAR